MEETNDLKFSEKLRDKERLISEQQKEIDELKKEIKRLNRIEKDFNSITHSIGWRVVSFPGNMYVKTIQFFKTLWKYIRVINITNIKYVFNAFKKGGFKQVAREMRDFRYRINVIEEMPLEMPELFDYHDYSDYHDYTLI